MGLDGFSMGNLGLTTDMTSAQMAVKAEQLAQKGTEFKIKDVNEMAKDKGVTEKKEHEHEKNQFNDGFKSKNDNDENEEENDNNLYSHIKNANELLSSLSEKDFENKDPKEFSVRINIETDTIELFSNKENRVLETMSADDLMMMMSKLSNASGVLVNRKI